MCVRVYTDIDRYVCVYIYIYIYTHTHTYAHSVHTCFHA